jgi:thiamine biosynthesis lipoprotein
MLHKLEFLAMGSQILVALDRDTDQPDKIVMEVPEWFADWEDTLSRFKSDSELSRLNRTFDQPVPVSQVLWDVFETALIAEEETAGLVTPTVLDAVIESGYDRSFDLLPRFQFSHGSNILTQVSPLSLVIYDEIDRTICLPEGLRLDFGGIAKGWAAHMTAERLSPFGPVLVDAGGDIAITSLALDGHPWQVGVRNPLSPSEDILTLKLGRCGVATSGRDHRRWVQNGLFRHHIIDPRTGLPAETDILTATVIAPTVMQAEAVAKASLIMGSTDALEFIDAHPDLAGLFILDFGGLVFSKRMQDFIWS